MRRTLIVLLALTLVACSSEPRIRVASKNFSEQYILGEIIAQHLENRLGGHVSRRFGLGGTLLTHQALVAGEIDVYPEYTGTALTAVLKQKPVNDPAQALSIVRRGYAPLGLEWLDPLGFENTFAMVVRGDDAQKLHLRTMSDLAPIASKWRVGVGYEFLERPDGFPGWSSRYNLHFSAQPNVMDLGLLYRALLDHQVDIVAGNSTDGLIDSLHLFALEDDRHYFPPYDAVPIVRRAALEKFPELRAALSDLAGKLTAAEMRHLNAQVDADQRDVATVVRAFRASKNL